MAKFPLKLLPLFGVVLLLSVIGYFLIESDSENEGELIPDETAQTADISSKTFKAYQLDPDKGITWTLEAEEGDYSFEKGIGSFKKFRIKLHSEEGLDFELEGNEGKYNLEKNEISFSGKLKGKTNDGYMVYTENLTLQGKAGIIKSDDVVTFIGPFFGMTGKGLIMDLKKETLKILEDGKSTFDKESLDI